MGPDNSPLDRMATSVSRVSMAAAKAGASSSGTSIGQIGIVEVARGFQMQLALANQKQRRAPAEASRGVHQRVAPLPFVFKIAQPPRDLVQLLDQFPPRRLGRAIGLLHPCFERIPVFFLQARGQSGDGLLEHALHALRPLRFQHVPDALDMLAPGERQLLPNDIVRVGEQLAGGFIHGKTRTITIVSDVQQCTEPRLQ